MALSDIRQAIADEVDRSIAAARQRHERSIAEQRKTTEKETKSASDQSERRAQETCRMLVSSAEQRAQALRRNAVLAEKRVLIEETYDAVLDALSACDPSSIEPLLTKALHATGDGEIRPAHAHAALLKKLAPKSCTMGEPIEARGGFICSSPTREYDFRFETIVHSLLRPRTELQAAQALFPISS
jgi:vacuolar-type H+-ATPase subunit E/Vma4